MKTNRGSPGPDTAARGLAEAAFDAVGIGVGIVDASSRFIRVNTAFAALHGLSPAAMAGREFTLLLPGEPDDLPGQPPGSVQRRLLRPNGSTVDVLVTAGPIHDGTHEGATVVTLTDITGQKRAEGELRLALKRAVEARAAASALVAGMSQELRTPLSAVMAFAEVLVNQSIGPLQPPAYGDFAADIQTSGRRLMEVLGDVLDMAKLEAGLTPLADRDVNLGELIDETASEVLARTRHDTASVKCDVDWSVGIVRVDPVLLQRALGTLMSAALEGIGADGSLRVGAFAVPDGRCLISVSAAHKAAHQAVQRGRLGGFMPLGPEDGASRGLGLSAAQVIVQVHGGTLLVDGFGARGAASSLLLPISRVRRRRLAPIGCILRVGHRPSPIACAAIDGEELRLLAGGRYRLDSLGLVLEASPVPGDMPDHAVGALAGRHLLDDLAPSLRAAGVADLLHRGLVERDLDVLLAMPCPRRHGGLLHCRVRRGEAPDEAELVVRLV